MNPHIKILILNWNGLALTRECIISIKDLMYDNFSITVIDNFSEDDSIKEIHRDFPNIEVLALDKNYGFSCAYNFSFENIQLKDDQYLLILNNDTIVEPDLLNIFVENMLNHGEEHIYCPMIYYLNDRNKIWYAGGKINLKRGVLEHNGIRSKDIGQFPETCETGYVTGCCIFVSHKTIFHLKGFDENFNMYAEDVDLSIRAREAGIKSIFVPHAKIYHKVSASIGGEFNLFKLNRKIQSVKKLMLKHCTYLEFIYCYPIYIIRLISKLFFRNSINY